MHNPSQAQITDEEILLLIILISLATLCTNLTAQLGLLTPVTDTKVCPIGPSFKTQPFIF